jgi:hypothetical protein
LSYGKGSRPVEGFATGRDFASTVSGAISPRPRNHIVPQQIEVAVAVLCRAG